MDEDDAEIAGVAHHLEDPPEARRLVRLDPAIDRTRVMEALGAVGIPSRPYFSPLHLQPAFADLGYRAGDFPVTERVAASTLALPFSPRLTDAEVSRVGETLVKVLARARVGRAATGVSVAATIHTPRPVT